MNQYKRKSYNRYAHAVQFLETRDGELPDGVVLWESDEPIDRTNGYILPGDVGYIMCGDLRVHLQYGDWIMIDEDGKKRVYSNEAFCMYYEVGTETGK